ncbi:MAG: hypothetical protein Q7Q71_05630 [Verrucomicrobiota bacterium JB023]|nr:hypothetical protein [Verrucomicrobiota bacterium JB023]
MDRKQPETLEEGLSQAFARESIRQRAHQRKVTKRCQRIALALIIFSMLILFSTEGSSLLPRRFSPSETNHAYLPALLAFSVLIVGDKTYRTTNLRFTLSLAGVVLAGGLIRPLSGPFLKTLFN